jgi:hypothetical protein
MRFCCAARSIFCSASLQITFEDVVNRAAAQRVNRPLLADRPRDEDEWNVGQLTARQGEGGHPVELRQREIRENDVMPAFAQRLDERLLGLDTRVDALDAVLAQASHRELRIRFDIFEKQHPHKHARHLLHRNGQGNLPFRGAPAPSYRSALTIIRRNCDVCHIMRCNNTAPTSRHSHTIARPS